MNFFTHVFGWLLAACRVAGRGPAATPILLAVILG
jgi:hypothetical protein